MSILLNWVVVQPKTFYSLICTQVFESEQEYFQSIRDRPVWQPISLETRKIIEQASLPEYDQSLEKYVMGHLLL